MTDIDRSNEGRRVELVRCNDEYTRLKRGDQGTYQFAIKNPKPIGTQHAIKWDNGSELMLLEGVDVFRFID